MLKILKRYCRPAQGLLAGVFLSAALLLPVAKVGRAADGVRLSDFTAHAVTDAQFVSHVSGDTPMHLSFALRLRDRAGAEELMHHISRTSDPLYGKYLATDELADKFGPTQYDYDSLVTYVQSQGFTIRKTHRSRMVLEVDATVASVEKAFGIHINNYQHANGDPFFAPDESPILPSTLVGKIWTICGLNNALKAQAHFTLANPLQPQQYGGSGTYGGMTPTDLRTAYNLNGVTETGTGQTLGLVEYDGYPSSAISAYTSLYSSAIPSPPPLDNVTVGGDFSGPSGTGSEDEVVLDIEEQMALAPGATGIRVYEANNDGTQGINMLDTIYGDAATVKVVSCSWGYTENDVVGDSAYYDAENDEFLLMGLAGQSFLDASGDHGACADGGTSFLDVGDPANQPYVTAVGGTALQTTSRGGAYESETSWYDTVDDAPNIEGGNGGVSRIFALPTYQDGAGGYSSTFRNVPDVSALADPNNPGYEIVFPNGAEGVIGGTSAAAPVWSGFVARINQRRLANTHPVVGFLNPVLYSLAAGGSYSTIFHDIADNSTIGGPYFAGTGYDNCTGLGSFNGANMMAAIGGTAAAGAPTISAAPGNAQVALSWSAVTGAVTYNIYRGLSSEGETLLAQNVTTASYTDLTAANGTEYFYEVSCENGGGEGALSNEVNATPAIAAPGVPTGLATTPGNTSAVLNWTATSTATSYLVRRTTTTGSGYSTIGSPSSNTYPDSGLTNGTTYFYGVAAVNAAGTSAFCADVSVVPALPLPGVPTSLNATPSNAQVALTWTASSNATSYVVEHSTTSGSGYSVISSPAGTSATDTGLTNGTTYYYKVAAVNATGTSAFCAFVSATPQMSAPPAPTALAATAGNAQVALTWGAATGATSYTLLRSTTSGSGYSTVTSQAGTTYTDTGVSNGTTYYYVVTASNGGGSSPNSNQASATPFVPSPGVPGGLTATPGNQQVVLTWSAVGGATTYNVKELGSNGLWIIVGTPTGTSYTVTGLTNGTAYTFAVSAVNSTGESANSSTVTSTPAPPTPSAPTNLAGTQQTTYASLSWTAVSGATSYTVLRSTTNGSGYVAIATGVLAAQYNDTSVVTGTTYYYVVTASNSSGTSANSSQVSVAMPALSSHTISWATSTAQASNVKWGTSSGSLTNTSSNGTLVTSHSVTITGLTPGTTYYYEYQAMVSGVMTWSPTKTFVE